MNSAKSLAIILFLALPALVFARGTAEIPPSVQLTNRSGVHISPNGDGVLDQLELEPAQTGDSTLAIKSFELTVFGLEDDLSGQIVWKRSEVQPENRGFFGDVFNVGEEPRVQIPDSLVWDGTFLASSAGEDGADVPDGNYIYQLVIRDEEGGIVTGPPLNVTVDREPPSVGAVTPEYDVFSPNDDGVRDTVDIAQSGSRELRWDGRIRDSAGNTVKTFLWSNTTPKLPAGDTGPLTAVWDGTTDSGAVADDGVYEYLLEGTDRAGNTASSQPVAIRLSTTAGAVSLVVETRAFSPNGDGIQDTASAQSLVSETEGLVGYTIELLAAGTTSDPLWTRTGEVPLPPEFVITGSDSRGNPLSDGSYDLVLTVSYENGNRSSSEPVTLVVDREPPRAIITAQTGPQESDRDAPFVFGGAGKQFVDIDVALSEESDWIAIMNLGDSNVRVRLSDLGITGTDFSIRWDGRDLDGSPVPDGIASLRFDTTDAAGNPGRSNQLQVIVDTREAEVAVGFMSETFSPNGDGINDTVRVATAYTVSDLIDQFLLSIADSEGRIVRTEYKRTPFTSFEWLGRSNGNTIVSDGTYYATLKVIYYNGNEPEARSSPILVDGTRPQIIELSAPYRLFSPDGDGERDTVTIHQETSEETEWRGQITDAAGTRVFERTWTGSASDFTWTGADQSGDTVPDGDYTYRISSEDQSGNTGEEHLTLVVDTRSVPISQQPPDVSISVGPLPFTPDGDGTNDRLTITTAAASENALRDWELVISDPFGGVVRRWSGSGSPRRFITWNGQAPNGELVQSAQEYTATLTVTDDRGNTGSENALIAVGILVIRDGLTLRIMVPSIHFAPNTADLFQVSDADLAQNLQTLRSLATVLNRYPDHQILIEGHAAHDYYVDGPRKTREQNEELLPLSASRAVEVQQALVILGVDNARMRTVGIGGARPVVPHSDRVNLWKNRRVEFILERRD